MHYREIKCFAISSTTHKYTCNESMVIDVVVRVSETMFQRQSHESQNQLFLFHHFRFDIFTSFWRNNKFRFAIDFSDTLKPSNQYSVFVRFLCVFFIIIDKETFSFCRFDCFSNPWLSICFFVFHFIPIFVF